MQNTFFKNIKIAIELSLISIALFPFASANAYTPGGEIVTIVEIVEWQDNANISFELSNGYYCYIPAQEKNMYALILSLYLSGQSARIHCQDAEEDIGGYKAHRLHRVVTIK